MTTVSVLIPAHNEADRLAECIASIRGQAHPVDQILVVADSCTDGTVEMARVLGADVVEATVGGKAAAQNAGLHHVTGDVLVCVDADTVLAANVLELFMQELADGVDATCANMLPMPQQRGLWVAQRRFAYALGRYWWRWCQGQVGRLMVLSGCAYAVRTETVRDLGGFPGDLITCDMDLTWEMYRHGYRTSFCHRALAYTYDPETYTVFRRQLARWASGFYQNFARHRRQLARPAAALVVGGALYDLLSLPVTYGLVAWLAWHQPASLRWVAGWLVLHAVATTFIASRTIGWRSALSGYLAYWLVTWLIKAIYLWAFIREWILGRHYASWTGRQGRATVITPMTWKRRLVLSFAAGSLLLPALAIATAVMPL